MRRLVPLLLLLVLAWLVVEPLALVAVDAVRENGSWTLAAVRAFLVGAERAARSAGTRSGSPWRASCSAACIGVPLALLTGLVDFPGRRVVGVLLALPAVLPPLVGVVAFLFLYGESGLFAHLVMAVTGAETPPWRFEGAGAVLLIHATTMYVYTYLLVRGALATFDPALLEAATSLGAARWRTFRTVVLPLLRPAIGNGALLTALTSLASFSAPYVFGGGFRVLPTQLVSTRLNGDIAVAMVETLALVAFSAGRTAARLAAGRTGDSRGREGDRAGAEPEALDGLPAGIRRAGLAGDRLAAAAASFALLLVSIVPQRRLELHGAADGVDREELPHPGDRPGALAALWHLAVDGGAGRECCRRCLPSPSPWWLAIPGTGLSRWLERGLALPWAVPGTVYAIALATMFSRLQPAAGRFVLIGTLWLLPLAYLVRGLPVVGPIAGRRHSGTRPFAGRGGGLPRRRGVAEFRHDHLAASRPSSGRCGGAGVRHRSRGLHDFGHPLHV